MWAADHRQPFCPADLDEFCLSEDQDGFYSQIRGAVDHRGLSLVKGNSFRGTTRAVRTEWIADLTIEPAQDNRNMSRKLRVIDLVLPTAYTHHYNLWLVSEG